MRAPWRSLPVNRWFDRKSAGAGDFVARLAVRALGIIEPDDRKRFIEAGVRDAFGFTRVELFLRPEGSERFSPHSTRVRDILSRVAGILQGLRQPYLSEELTREFGGASILQFIGATHVFPVGAGDAVRALLAVDAGSGRRLSHAEADALIKATEQIGIVLDNSVLLKRKLELEHELAKHSQMAQLGEMTARIAHEIKNPLSAIKTIVQVMQEDASLHPVYTRDLELITSEIDRLAGSLRQLLDFARPSSAESENISLKQAADSTLGFLRRDLDMQHAAVDNDIPDDLPLVRGTRNAFREIFLNLLLNAIQAGGDGVRVRLHAWESFLEDASGDRFVLLVVEDDGPGVPAEILDKLFQPFFTTRQRGTGLGLAIVKRNVEYLGGHVSVETPARDGRGTRFLIRLPLNP